MSEGIATFAESALAALLDLLDEGALVFEGEPLVCVAASARAAELLGVPHESLVGRPRGSILGAVLVGDEATSRALHALRGAADETTLRETVVIATEPSKVVLWVTAPVLWSGQAVGRVDVLTDHTAQGQLIAALERARERLVEVSLVDELTGLANRKHFENEIDREHRRSQRAWTSYAVARIDVDGMAALNEALGREAGDRLLRGVSQGLKAARREYDLVARWHEDELVVLLPGIDPTSVKAVLSRSIAAMREIAAEAAGREVTFCAGVAVWTPPSVESANDIVARAGTALTAAQLMGRGSVEIDARRVEWKDDAPQE